MPTYCTARFIVYPQRMNKPANIIIGDESALHLYLHCDGINRLGVLRTMENPLLSCATTSEQLCAFNSEHPFYGGEPVTVLVPDGQIRRKNSEIRSRVCSPDLPDRSFFRLRDGLYVISPELVLLRMARHVSLVQLIEMSMNLCARYYLDLNTGRIEGRTSFLTSTTQIEEYAMLAQGSNGSSKVRKALRWVLDNSGSPYESKSSLVFRLPLSWGGFGLLFDAMNFDVRAGRLACLAEQNEYCIDMVNIKHHVGFEYDGCDSHEDASHDKRRRNALAALGWTVFPIDKAVLHNPELCEKTAYQLARNMGHRIQKPRNWEEKCVKLRRSLQLPV